MPFHLDQYSDFKDPNVYMIYTWQGGLGLPDKEYYLKSGDRDEEIRAAYQSHIENMLILAELTPAEAKVAARKIMGLETKMATIHMDKEETRQVDKLYNPVLTGELNKLMPSFDWR